jgi:hypothetical protein
LPLRKNGIIIIIYSEGNGEMLERKNWEMRFWRFVSTKSRVWGCVARIGWNFIAIDYWKFDCGSIIVWRRSRGGTVFWEWSLKNQGFLRIFPWNVGVFLRMVNEMFGLFEKAGWNVRTFWEWRLKCSCFLRLLAEMFGLFEKPRLFAQLRRSMMAQRQ